MANDADLRRKAPNVAARRVRRRDADADSRPGRHAGDRRVPLPGSAITREYKGGTLAVKVLPAGFEYEGEIYKSLSAVAKKITGSHCNGYHFFRLTKEGGDR